MALRIRLPALVLAAALLLTGCSLPAVQEMYQPPRRAEDADGLQNAMNEAMKGLSFCAPVSGENRQNLQQADLNGDGVEEYILFAKGESERPLQVLIFGKKAAGYRLLDTIESNGTAFEQVEYVDVDGEPGVEIILGCRMNEHLIRSLGVYSFSGGITQRMSANYHKFLTCDLNRDGVNEVLLLRTDQGITSAALYSVTDGAVQPSPEILLSGSISDVAQITVSPLADGQPAVYLSGIRENDTIIQLLTVNNGELSVFTVENLSKDIGGFEDIDADSIPELPQPMKMRRLGTQAMDMIRWFAVDGYGRQIDKCYTFHDFSRQWYLTLPMEWIDRLSGKRTHDGYNFYVWNESFTDYEQVFSIHILTGDDREEQAQINNRFVLYRTEDLVYAARLETPSAAYGITQESLINSFRLIRVDWKKGET